MRAPRILCMVTHPPYRPHNTDSASRNSDTEVDVPLANFRELRACEVRRILLPRTRVHKSKKEGRGLLRRLPLPSPPEQIYPCTSTARTCRRTLYLPPTAPRIQPALATPETTRRLALSPSTRQGRQSSAPSSTWWWDAW